MHWEALALYLLGAILTAAVVHGMNVDIHDRDDRIPLGGVITASALWPVWALMVIPAFVAVALGWKP